MSGSGGFYKYHCKNFLTYNCQNWVFVNNAPCADCCAAGRDDRCSVAGTSALSEMEIGVPIFQNGILRYALVEMIHQKSLPYQLPAHMQLPPNTA
ncbi:hypothetical protein CMQ_6766 [Grosmannia clavigera kw1407]|uniref:Uncharacterized protein n=1 Tax=Grosmannia clavigera (strain kw1407 / UAMH 11150) TaxID=655863 RepID=F0X7K5_GROCL|nr:uncharacterized protein CMQ_6766 [Grosmannia clavigera kw1407]EFX06445.1 hypothetical protein CMQ_6766 [Grosmannia clavigera kw1407]